MSSWNRGVANMDSGCCQLPSQLLMTEFKLKVLGWTCPKSIMPSWVKADSHWSAFWNALSTALNVITSSWEVKDNNPPANFHCLPFSHALIMAEYVSSFAATRRCCISTRRCAAINQYPWDAVALMAEELLNTFLAAKCCVKSDHLPLTQNSRCPTGGCLVQEFMCWFSLVFYATATLSFPMKDSLFTAACLWNFL